MPKKEKRKDRESARLHWRPTFHVTTQSGGASLKIVSNLVPRDRDPFGQRQGPGSVPLDKATRTLGRRLDSFIIGYQYAEWHHNNFKAFSPGKTAYDTDRGSCCCTKSSFMQALKPVLFMYWQRKHACSNQRELAAKSCHSTVGQSQKSSFWHPLSPTV